MRRIGSFVAFSRDIRLKRLLFTRRFVPTAVNFRALTENTHEYVPEIQIRALIKNGNHRKGERRCWEAILVLIWAQQMCLYI